MTTISNPRTLQRMMAERAILLQRATKARADLADLTPRMDAAYKEAQQAVAAHDNLKRQHDQLADEIAGNETEAEDLLGLVNAAADAMGWPYPAEVEDPAMQETGSFEAVQPGDATQVIPADDGPFTVGPMTPEAEALWGHARITSTVTVHWKGGGHITGIVRAKFDDRLIVHDGDAVYDLNPADVATVEPADAAPEVIDRPATTPAAEGGERQ